MARYDVRQKITSPLTFICVGAVVEQQLHNVGMPVSCRRVQRGPAFDVPWIYVCDTFD